MVGRKSKVLFDSIDLKILEILDNYYSKHQEKGMGILELTKRIKLTHQNLKTHLEKLIKTGVILTITFPNSNRIELVTPKVFMSIKDKDIQKDAEEHEVLLSFLRKANSLETEKKTISQISKEMKKEKLKERINE